MSALKPGDYAFVIRCHCEKQERQILDMIVLIHEIPPALLDGWECCACSGAVPLIPHAVIQLGERYGYLPLAWLRKIEPLTDAEKTAEDQADPIHRVVPAKV